MRIHVGLVLTLGTRGALRSQKLQYFQCIMK